MNLRCNNRDITLSAGGLTWTNTINELATKLSFEIPKLNAQHTQLYYPQIDDPVGIDMELLGRVFQGTVIIVDDGDPTTNKYTVVDWGFYLNKETLTIQFDNNTIAEAISKVVDWRIDTLIGVEGKTSGEYIDKKKSEILDELLKQAEEQTGYAFNYDVTPKGLRVYRLGDLHADPKFTLSQNKNWSGTTSLPSAEFRGDETHTISIEDGTKETYSFTIIDDQDNYVRAGEEIKVEGNTFIIQSAEHSVERDWHKVRLGVRRVG